MKVSSKETEGEALAIGLTEAAKRLQVSERTLWALAKANKVPHKRVGKQYRFSPAVLREWMASGVVTHE
ncbi:MAG: helix-turn-helix domain-containing protein [Pirellulaceae bacterium]